MNKLYLGIITVIVVLFSGCVPTYNIEPTYNNETKTLIIDSLKLDNVVHNRENIEVDMYHTYKKADYLLKNKTCNKVNYYKVKANSDDNAYVSNNLEYDLKEIFLINDDGDCEVTKIANVKFYKCVKSTYIDKKYFYIGTDTPSFLGFSSKTKLKTDQECFDTLLEHFKKDEKSKNSEIKNYTFAEYDKNGFDENGIHKDTRSQYDNSGYTKRGFNVDGFHRNGTNYNNQGFNRFDYDINGFDPEGYNVNQIHKDTGTKYNLDGYDLDGKKKS